MTSDCKNQPASQSQFKIRLWGPGSLCLIEASVSQICKLIVARTLHRRWPLQFPGCPPSIQPTPALDITPNITPNPTRVTQLATLVREIGSTTETVVASRSISTSCQGKFPILEILAGLPPLKRPPAAPFPFGGRPHFRFAQVLPGSDQPRFLPNRPISTSQPEFPVCPSLPPPAVRIDNLDIQVSTNPWSRTCHSPTRHLRALGALPPIGDTKTRPLAHFSIASRPCRHRTPSDARM
jgi:hypothetical protein